jgi:glycolate oxidase
VSSAAQLQAVRAALAAVDGLELRDDPGTLTDFGHDESDQGSFPPQLVVFPRTTAEVQAVFRACAAQGVPVTPVGARSGKSGGSLAVAGGVALCLTRMDRIVSVSRADLTAVVEPGVILETLQRTVEAEGLFYPPDPNSADLCTLGGNVAENAGGPRCLKYGVTRDYVLGLTWVLPSGEALEVGRRTIKGVAGYDLVGLFVGSEGTLGVATRITLKLLPLPRAVMTALLPFASVAAAATAVSEVLAAGVLPRCLELLDDVALGAIDGQGFTFPPGCGAVLIAEVDGASQEGVLAELTRLSEVAAAHGALETLLAQDRDQRERLWAARRAVSPALRALKKFKFSEDIVVPRSRIPEAIARFKAVGAELGLTVATYGHAGDGNLHTNVLYSGPAERPCVEKALERIMCITVELGGTITGEHGVGLSKKRFLSLEQSPSVIDLQRRLKVFFDPQVLLNPGKMFPEP